MILKQPTDMGMLEVSPETKVAVAESEVRDWLALYRRADDNGARRPVPARSLGSLTTPKS